MNILHLIFSWLLSSSVRASLLALAVLCLRAAPGRWLPARWRYALWLPVLLVLAAPILPASRWSMENLFAHQPLAIKVTSFSAPAIATSLAEAPGGEMLPAPAHSAAVGMVDLFLMTWSLGATGILVAGGIGYARTLRRLARNRVRTLAVVAEAVQRAVEEAGLRHSPRVLVSTAVDSPAVAGLFRPVLLLPSSFPDGFTRDEARLILLHELTHLKSWDLPLNWLLCVLQALHWFNPMLWFAFGRIRADREAACDARVLCIDALDRRADYGQALLKLQDIAPRFGLSLAFVGIFERSGIRSRIRAIGSHRPVHPAWSGVAIAMIAVLLVLGATHAAETIPAPALASRSSGKPYVQIDAALIEVPANKPVDITSEEIHLTGPDHKGGSFERLFKQTGQEAKAALNQIMGMNGSHIIARPRIMVDSGRDAQIVIGDNSDPSGKPDAVAPSISLDVQPTVVDGKITLHATFSRSSHVDMREISTAAGKTVIEDAGVHGKDAAKGRLVTTTLTCTGNATLKDGETFGMLEKEEGVDEYLFIFLDARLADAAGNSRHTSVAP